MNMWRYGVPFLAIGLMGCASNSSDGPASAEERGSLSVALVGTASDGTQYRLRDGDFAIVGYPEYQQGESSPPSGGGGAGGGGGNYFFDSASTETDPDATVITKRLVPGWYYMTLMQGWRIEQLTPSGPVAVEQSVLLSEATQYTYVYHGGTSDVFYRFGVGGEIIDFRSGDLNIQVEFELPGEGQSQGGFGGFAGSSPAAGQPSMGGAASGI